MGCLKSSHRRPMGWVGSKLPSAAQDELSLFRAEQVFDFVCCPLLIGTMQAASPALPAFAATERYIYGISDGLEVFEAQISSVF